MPQVVRGFRSFIRWVVLIGVFGFVLLVVGSYIGTCAFKQRNPPSINEAPWAIQTSSRGYYAKIYSVENGVPTITDYWLLDDKGHYIHVKGSMAFLPRLFGQVAVIRRTK